MKFGSEKKLKRKREREKKKSYKSLVQISKWNFIFMVLSLEQSLMKRKRARHPSSQGSYAEVPLLCGDDLFLLRSSPRSENVDINPSVAICFFFYFGVFFSVQFCVDAPWRNTASFYWFFSSLVYLYVHYLLNCEEYEIENYVSIEIYSQNCPVFSV